MLIVGEEVFTEAQLLQQGTVFIVLAEPGAGKTELLKTLANHIHSTPVKASIFRHQTQASPTHALVIDAMDEVARIDSLATDEIITKASGQRASKVVFAGRSGEWDQGRTSHVESCFGVKPVIVRLQPFNRSEQLQLFEAEFPEEDFSAFTAEVQKFELEPLLGNPQFLKLLGAAFIESGRFFTSKRQIFSDAVRRLAHEANSDSVRQKARPPTDKIVAIGSEIFAKLLLSGATGIDTVEKIDDRDFPYINSLCRSDPLTSFLIDTKLLKPSDDVNRHEPVHRIVAEYCAANYIAQRIEAPADRLSSERIFAVVAPNGVVRDELRGLLGWIAALGREPLQLAAVKLDPYAVLANGDPSQLTPHAKRELLAALERLASSDPMFRRSDQWRSFNVGHFFTTDILEAVRSILNRDSALRELLLELLVETEAAAHLIPELRKLVTDPSVEDRTRKHTLLVLLSTETYDPSLDFSRLVNEASHISLEIAARAVTVGGVQAVGTDNVGALLSNISLLYTRSNNLHREFISLYFVRSLIESFEIQDTMKFMDVLTQEMICKCSPKHDYQCTCRSGKSKVVAKLLDHYFDLNTIQHDPARIYSWLEPLHFRNQVSDKQTASVMYLAEHDDLRRSVQMIALQGAIGETAACAAVDKLLSFTGHSGLRVREGDLLFLTEHAFANEMIDVWRNLYVGHDVWKQPKRPNPIRAMQRLQSRSSPAFLAAWALRERQSRNYIRKMRKDIGGPRSERNYERKLSKEKQDQLAHLRRNLALIEAGGHWGWLHLFAQVYLIEPDELRSLVDDPETPLRALRNCFDFLDPHIPTVEALGRREGTHVAQVLLAACLVLYRDGRDMATVDRRVLAAVKADISGYPAFKDGEEAAFEGRIDNALFETRAPKRLT
jgi:hypothetical protein